MRAWCVAAVAMAWACAGCANHASPCGTCAFGLSCCDSTCVDMLTDPQNCGGCGAACGTGQVCLVGSCGVRTFDAGPRDAPGTDAVVAGCGTGLCQPPCLAAFMCCSTGWVLANGVASGDGRHDPSFTNCGACGSQCDPMRATRCGLAMGATSGPPECLCGAAPMCGSTRMCLSITATDWGCFDPQTDPMHCGAALTACATGEACMAGMCTCAAAHMQCPTGQVCTATGCVDTMTDAMNCGMIGHACHAGENCMGGMCHCGTGPTCMPPGGFGSSNCGQVCCNDQCIYASDTDCGGCGMACTGGQVCSKGVAGAMVHCAAMGAMFTIQCDPPPPPTDAGVDDAGPTDAGVPDAGVVDANTGVDANADGGP